MMQRFSMLPSKFTVGKLP